MNADGKGENFLRGHFPVIASIAKQSRMSGSTRAGHKGKGEIPKPHRFQRFAMTAINFLRVVKWIL